jgi:hypothetical protein
VGRADHTPRGVLPSVVCLSVIVKPQQRGGPGPLGAVAPWTKKNCIFNATMASHLKANSDD